MGLLSYHQIIRPFEIHLKHQLPRAKPKLLDFWQHSPSQKERDLTYLLSSKKKKKLQRVILDQNCVSESSEGHKRSSLSGQGGQGDPH